jgi:hypothetical protein
VVGAEDATAYTTVVPAPPRFERGSTPRVHACFSRSVADPGFDFAQRPTATFGLYLGYFFTMIFKSVAVPSPVLDIEVNSRDQLLDCIGFGASGRMLEKPAGNPADVHVHRHTGQHKRGRDDYESNDAPPGKKDDETDSEPVFAVLAHAEQRGRERL